MKRLIMIACVLFGVLPLSCGRNGKTVDNAAEVAGTTRGGVIEADSLPVKINITDGIAKVEIRKTAMQPVMVEFDSDDAGILHAAITGVQDTANIRFNQIIMPNGAADGPFGRTMEYTLTRKGEYELSIGESLMEGEPWGGVFTLEVRLSENVPYTVGRNYFVKNSFTESTLRENTINTKEQFDTIFGKAAVMGSVPTPIDFEKQYVIAILEPITDDAVYLKPLSLIKTGEEIVMTYERKVGKKRSYFTRPFLMLIVSRDYSGEVEITEAR